MEDFKEIKFEMERLQRRQERLEQRDRQREATLYSKISQLERTVGDSQTIAIAVLGGGLVALGVMVFLMLK